MRITSWSTSSAICKAAAICLGPVTMPSSARILLLVENNAYPFDVRVRREAQALASAGYQVCVIAPRGPRQTWNECIDGVDIYRFPAPPGGRGLFGYAFEFVYATIAMLL